MNDCQPKVLIDLPDYSIVQCIHCGRIGFFYRNVLIGFDVLEFFNFSTALLSADFDRRSLYFPDRKKHLVVNTGHQDIQLTFTRRELSRINDGLNQARLLIEADFHTKHSSNFNP